MDALFKQKTAVHLSGRPLAREHRLSVAQNGCTRLQDTVKDTLELRWWSLGFGDKVKVLASKTLRKALAATAEKFELTSRTIRCTVSMCT
ncbi:MAG: WYL domain-containing protein [Nitrospira sp.]|nr:WYL domain-containing protein [Nitrospira sp.]